MLDITKDIESLSNFKRRTADFLDQMRESGRPIVLTVNGKAELVVQDSASYQRLMERAELAETADFVRNGRADVRAGRTKPMREALKRLGTK